MSNFERFVAPVKVTEGSLNDARLAEARAADDAARLTPGESKILFESLSPERQAEIHQQALAHSPGATRTRPNPETGEMETVSLGGIQRGSAAAAKPGVEGILATARSLGGRSLGSWEEVDDKTIFTVDGITLPASTAARMGIIVKDRYGYRPAEVTAQTPEQLAEEAAAKAKAEADAAPIDFLSDSSKAALGNIDQLAGGFERTESIIASTLGRVASGKDATQPLVAALNINPAEAQTAIDAHIEHGVAAAGEYLTKTYGIDGPATLDHIASTMSAGERAQLAIAMYRGDRSAFQRCAEIGRKLARAANAAEQKEANRFNRRAN